MEAITKSMTNEPTKTSVVYRDIQVGVGTMVASMLALVVALAIFGFGIITFLSGDISNTENRLNARMDRVEGRINERIDKLEARIGGLEVKIDRIESKIDALQ